MADIEHEDITAPKLHVPGFMQSDDPADTPSNNVRTGIYWLDTTLANTSVLKVRNAANDDWVNVLTTILKAIADPASGEAGTIIITNDGAESPGADPGWASSSTVDMTPPDGYIRAYVGTTAVVIPYWDV